MGDVPYIIQQTELFASWHRGLRDLRARIAIARRLDRAAAGNLGDVKSVGEGVSEMRIDVGAGYRVYFMMRGGVIVILLCGGEKKTQRRDIQRAAQLAKEV
jgi:putative addiction module killer protein